MDDHDCPSAAHGTDRDPYGCYERQQREERLALRAYEAEQRRLTEARAKALEDAADRSQERVGINPLWLRDDAEKIRKGVL